MTSKERMVLALNREKPDRLPVTIHQWQPYHLATHMGGVSDIEANRVCGLDASITFFETLEMPSPDWRLSSVTSPADGYIRIDHTIETPGGTLRYQQGRNAITTWVSEHLIKGEAELELVRKYRPVPLLDRDKARKVHAELGDGGILRTFLCGFQGGCWQDACELYGAENLIMATFDRPDFVHELLAVLQAEKLRYIEESLPGMPFDLIETGGGAASNTLISPAIHEEFCLPYDRVQHDALHALGFKTVYHTCGGMSRITHLVRDNHCDASETLSPTGVGGDIDTDATARQVYSDLHPTLALIGGMDQNNILERGDAAMIDREVERLFGLYGQDGGYILSACDHFFAAPGGNIARFAAAARTYTY
ncbi:MAG: uroporphyrinogen decarboxylase family protein [Spirochaetota bacterium]